MRRQCLSGKETVTHLYNSIENIHPGFLSGKEKEPVKFQNTILIQKWIQIYYCILQRFVS